MKLTLEKLTQIIREEVKEARKSPNGREAEPTMTQKEHEKDARERRC